MTFGPRARNDLDLEYSYTFIYSISCLHLQTFRSQATIVSEKSTFSFFPIQKTCVTKFDLAVKYVKVNQKSSFEQTMMELGPQWHIPRFVEIG